MNTAGPDVTVRVRLQTAETSGSWSFDFISELTDVHERTTASSKLKLPGCVSWGLWELLTLQRSHVDPPRPGRRTSRDAVCANNVWEISFLEMIKMRVVA